MKNEGVSDEEKKGGGVGVQRDGRARMLQSVKDCRDWFSGA